MPFLRTVRKSKWYKHEAVPWLPVGALQADALTDLETTDNSLSIWIVLAGSSNLPRVIAAIASNRDALVNLDYVLIQEAVPATLGISTEQSTGGSPDEEANANWHLHLTHLSAAQIAQLATHIQSAATVQRVSVRTVAAHISSSLSLGLIAREKVRRGVLAKLQALSP